MVGVTERFRWGITGEELKRFAYLESLAQKLWRAHFEHWEDALRLLDDWLLVYAPGIGSETVTRLRQFQRDLESQRRDAQLRPEHLVEISPPLKERYPGRRFVFIDGSPFVLVHPAMNFYMVSLLRGELVKEEMLSGQGITFEDLQKDLDFLNQYFDLGLGLKRGDELKLIIPKGTKVISSPSFIAQ